MFVQTHFQRSKHLAASHSNASTLASGALTTTNSKNAPPQSRSSLSYQKSRLHNNQSNATTSTSTSSKILNRNNRLVARKDCVSAARVNSGSDNRPTLRGHSPSAASGSAKDYAARRKCGELVGCTRSCESEKPTVFKEGGTQSLQINQSFPLLSSDDYNKPESCANFDARKIGSDGISSSSIKLEISKCTNHKPLVASKIVSSREQACDNRSLQNCLNAACEFCQSIVAAHNESKTKPELSGKCCLAEEFPFEGYNQQQLARNDYDLERFEYHSLNPVNCNDIGIDLRFYKQPARHKSTQVGYSLLKLNSQPAATSEQAKLSSLGDKQHNSLLSKSLGNLTDILDNLISRGDCRVTSERNEQTKSTIPETIVDAKHRETPQYLTTWYDYIRLGTIKNSKFLLLFVTDLLGHQLDSLCHLGRGLFWLKTLQTKQPRSSLESNLCDFGKMAASNSVDFGSNSTANDEMLANTATNRRLHRFYSMNDQQTAATNKEQRFHRTYTYATQLERPRQLNLSSQLGAEGTSNGTAMVQGNAAAFHNHHIHRHKHNIRNHAPAQFGASNNNYALPAALARGPAPIDRAHWAAANRVQLLATKTTNIISGTAREHSVQQESSAQQHLHKLQLQMRHTVDGSPLMRRQVACVFENAPTHYESGLPSDDKGLLDGPGSNSLKLAHMLQGESRAEFGSQSSPTLVDDINYAKLRTCCWQQQQQAFSLSCNESRRLAASGGGSGKVPRDGAVGHNLRHPEQRFGLEMFAAPASVDQGKDEFDVEFHSLDAGFGGFCGDYKKHANQHGPSRGRQDPGSQLSTPANDFVRPPSSTNGSDTELSAHYRKVASHNGSYVHRPMRERPVANDRLRHQHCHQHHRIDPKPTTFEMDISKQQQQHNLCRVQVDEPEQTSNGDSESLVDNQHLMGNLRYGSTLRRGCSLKSTSPDSRVQESRSRNKGVQSANNSGAAAAVNSCNVSGESSRSNNHLLISTPLGKVSLSGAKRRLGFKQKGLISLSVQRSEEIYPEDWTFGSSKFNHPQRQCATATNSLNSSSIDEPKLEPVWLRYASKKLITPEPLIEAKNCDASFNDIDPRICFVDGLGVGQIASRQALVAPYLGDIQLSISDQRDMLEVEIIRVRKLLMKPCAKRLPSPYVKVYLMRNKKCLAKFKTSQANRTLDPMFQERFIFRDDYSHCVLQVIVWGYYGKKDRKALMGVVQIHLDELDMSRSVIGWYKLFNALSVTNMMTTSSKALRQTMSSTKIGEQLQRSLSNEFIDEENHH